jgi:hypothetical protein
LRTAARQTLAEPSSLVVTARVQGHVAGLLVAEERGGHDLKGVPAGDFVSIVRERCGTPRGQRISHH